MTPEQWSGHVAMMCAHLYQLCIASGMEDAEAHKHSTLEIRQALCATGAVAEIPDWLAQTARMYDKRREKETQE